MTESQSVSKRQKSDYDSVHDRLSDLPLSIIHTILSSLSTKDAVRTSILSTQWRYTWTGLPKLEFIRNADRNNSASEQCLKEFISYALSVHKGSLHTFKLRGVLEQPCPNLDEWLIRLSTKDIRELTLVIKSPLLSVHSSIYSCNKLTGLRLFCCDVGPPPPIFNGFLFLRNLTLLKVKISNATIESLVSNSPLLERVALCQLERDEKHSILRVHAPNLKVLVLIGWWTEMSTNAPLLSEIKIMLLAAIDLHRVSFCNYTSFLGGCTNLEKLAGSCQFLQVMSINIESWNPNSLVFHRLRNISLEDVDFLDVKQQSVLARLLVGAPNLQDLSIRFALLQARISSETRDAHFSGFEFESSLRMEKLRFVKMVKVRGLLPEIKLIKFLLERSPLLEAMSVLHIERLGSEEIKDLTDEILGCTRASQNAEISVLQV